MARAVALAARDVRRVGLTAHASRSGAVERRSLPTAAVATLDKRDVAPGVEAPPGKIAPARRRPCAGPRGLRGWPFRSPTRAGAGGSRACGGT